MVAPAKTKCVVRTLAGEVYNVTFSDMDTVWSVKQQLAANSGFTVGGMKLIYGEKILQDSWVLSEHGVADDSEMNLVIVPIPFEGTFKYENATGLRGGPVARNTSATAVFGKDGSIHLTVEETEITSQIKGADWKTYPSKAECKARYSGVVNMTSEREFKLIFSNLDFQLGGNNKKKTRGISISTGASEFQGELCDSNEEGKEQIRLHVYFASPGHEGGLQWVTLQEITEDNSDEDQPGSPMTPTRKIADRLRKMLPQFVKN